MPATARAAAAAADPALSRAHFTSREAAVWESEHVRSAPAERRHVLVISCTEDDHARLRGILEGAGFDAQSARTAADGCRIMRRAPVPVVVANCRLDNRCWKDVWKAISRLASNPRPRLIVAADAASEGFWAEVVEVGAYDVIARPFDPKEVLWVVTDAWTQWERERDLT